MSDTSELTWSGLGGESFSTALLGFVRRLRDASVPVSMVEALDAVTSLPHLDLMDRTQLRAGLAATLVKRVEHRSTFDSLFDAYFAVRRERSQIVAEQEALTSLDRTTPGRGATEGGGPGEAGEPASAALLEALLEALRTND